MRTVYHDLSVSIARLTLQSRTGIFFSLPEAFLCGWLPRGVTFFPREKKVTKESRRPVSMTGWDAKLGLGCGTR